MPRLTHQKREELRAALLAGRGVSEVAASFGVSRQAVSAIKNAGKRGSGKSVAGTIVGVRLTDKETLELDRRIKSGAFSTRGAVLRGLIRCLTGVFEADEGVIEELAALRKEVNSLGTNINQIAFSVNAEIKKTGRAKNILSLQSDIRIVQDKVDDVSLVLQRVLSRSDHKASALRKLLDGPNGQ